VEPVDSPTCCLAQVISVTIGNGEYVSVTAESGTFEVSGTFSANEPVTVSIGLLPGTTHHLQVAARVRESNWGGCSYGGYTLYTDRDRLGQPLVIVQGDGCHSVYVPLIVKDAPP
jgi:spore coat protein U-like protein